jgi:hypothetical protein
VDGLHVKGVAEGEGDLLLGAEVAQPIPTEHALDGDSRILAVGFEQPEKWSGSVGMFPWLSWCQPPKNSSHPKIAAASPSRSPLTISPPRPIGSTSTAGWKIRCLRRRGALLASARSDRHAGASRAVLQDTLEVREALISAATRVLPHLVEDCGEDRWKSLGDAALRVRPHRRHDLALDRSWRLSRLRLVRQSPYGTQRKDQRHANESRPLSILSHSSLLSAKPQALSEPHARRSLNGEPSTSLPQADCRRWAHQPGLPSLLCGQTVSRRVDLPCRPVNAESGPRLRNPCVAAGAHCRSPDTDLKHGAAGTVKLGYRVGTEASNLVVESDKLSLGAPLRLGSSVEIAS